MREIEMRKMHLVVIASVLLSSGVTFAESGPATGDVRSCRIFVQNGGMPGVKLDKMAALAKCEKDSGFRAQVLKSKATTK
jgi:hypothetical protein